MRDIYELLHKAVEYLNAAIAVDLAGKSDVESWYRGYSEIYDSFSIAYTRYNISLIHLRIGFRQFESCSIHIFENGYIAIGEGPLIDVYSGNYNDYPYRFNQNKNSWIRNNINSFLYKSTHNLNQACVLALKQIIYRQNDLLNECIFEVNNYEIAVNIAKGHVIYKPKMADHQELNEAFRGFYSSEIVRMVLEGPGERCSCCEGRGVSTM